MGKINLKYFLKNIFKLIKIFFIRKEINWNYISLKIENSEISKEAKIYGPCSIKKISVGKGTYISINSSISYTTIGKFCSIGPNLVCGWGIHPLHGISTSPIFYSTMKQVGFTFAESNLIEERKPISIGNDVFIGANVTILDGVIIGDGAVIGAGAIVNKDIPAYAVAVGCPIQIIKYRFNDETIKKLLQFQWWNRDDEYLKKLYPIFFDIQQILDNID